MSAPVIPADQIPERTQIRRAVVALLRDQTRAQGRVESSRVDTIEHPEDDEPLGDFYPRINVYTNDENTQGEEFLSESPLTLQRVLELEVEILVKAAEEVDADDQADEIERTVSVLLLGTQERVQYGVRFLGLDFVDMIVPLRTELTLEEDGDSPSGSRVVTFAVRYELVFGPRAEDDLLRIETDFDTERQTNATPEIQAITDLKEPQP